jgi:hypothetical protein
LIQIKARRRKRRCSPIIEIGVRRMPIQDIIVLSLIVTVFTAFGIILAGVTWYCSDKRKRLVTRGGHRNSGFPRGADVIVDD